MCVFVVIVVALVGIIVIALVGIIVVALGGIIVIALVGMIVIALVSIIIIALIAVIGASFDCIPMLTQTVHFSNRIEYPPVAGSFTILKLSTLMPNLPRILLPTSFNFPSISCFSFSFRSSMRFVRSARFTR